MKEPVGESKCPLKNVKVKDCFYNQVNGGEFQRKENEPLCIHCYEIDMKPKTNQPTPECKEKILKKGKIKKDYFIPEVVQNGDFIIERLPTPESNIGELKRYGMCKKHGKVLSIGNDCPKCKPESKEGSVLKSVEFTIKYDGAIDWDNEIKPESKDWKKEFRKRFKNPKNTGYRVGQEFLGAIEIFISDTIRSEKKKSYELAMTRVQGVYDMTVSQLMENESQAKEELKKEFQKLIAKEIVIAQKEGQPTSRLTSLANNFSK